MSYKDPTYVVFDGDEDKWAYAFMKGWKQNERLDFDFRDAHDLDTMTGRAQDEAYVKGKLRDRMKQSKAVIILVGEKTKNLYRFVRWEIELALDLQLPIIVANLNEKRRQDIGLCPAIIRGKCAVHVPFKMRAIKYAMDNWPAEYKRLDAAARAGGARHYADQVYRSLGI